MRNTRSFCAPNTARLYTTTYPTIDSREKAACDRALAEMEQKDAK